MKRRISQATVIVAAVALFCSLPALALAAPPAQHPLTLGQAESVDRGWESGYFGVSRRAVSFDQCKRGPHGNFGCDYTACLSFGMTFGRRANVSMTYAGPARVQFLGHDEVSLRHGQARVLEGGWLHIGHGC